MCVLFEIQRSFNLFLLSTLISIDECEYKYANEVVVECGNIFADYIYGKYRFVPKQSTNTFSVRTLAIDLDMHAFGILTSHRYPTYEASVNDSAVLATLDPTKSIRLIITDLLIADSSDSGCVEALLEADDGLAGKSQWCGNSADDFEYITCSETLTVSYRTSKGQRCICVIAKWQLFFTTSPK